MSITSRNCAPEIRGKARSSNSIGKGCDAISLLYGHTRLSGSSLPVEQANVVFLDGYSVCDSNGLIGSHKLLQGAAPTKLSRLDSVLGCMPHINVLSGIYDFNNIMLAIRKSF